MVRWRDPRPLYLARAAASGRSAGVASRQRGSAAEGGFGFAGGVDGWAGEDAQEDHEDAAEERGQYEPRAAGGGGGGGRPWKYITATIRR